MYLPPLACTSCCLASLPDWTILSSIVHSPQSIFVCIAQLLEDGSRRLGARWLAIHHVEEAQLVLNNVCNSLCIGGGARAATPDSIGDAGQLVGHTVGDVGAGGGTGVSTWGESRRGQLGMLLERHR